jgi:hypothetical protein
MQESIVVGNFRYGAKGYVEEVARANPGLVFVGYGLDGFDPESGVKIINPRTGDTRDVNDSTEVRPTAEQMLGKGVTA